MAHTTEQLSLNEKTTTTLKESDREQTTVDTTSSPISSQQRESVLRVDSPTTMWKDLLEKYSDEIQPIDDHWETEENIQ